LRRFGWANLPKFRDNFGERDFFVKIGDFLAVGAVIGEPVSVAEFPVQRENTAKFGRLRRVMTIQPSHSRANSGRFQSIPSKSEEGILLSGTGNCT
jgi:hypothetical protein